MSRKGSPPRRPGPARRPARSQGTSHGFTSLWTLFVVTGSTAARRGASKAALHRDSAVLALGRGGLATAIRAPLRCEQTH